MTWHEKFYVEVRRCSFVMLIDHTDYYPIALFHVTHYSIPITDGDVFQDEIVSGWS